MISERSPREKVTLRLKSVETSRRFFGEKNPDVDFSYTDQLIADAKRVLNALPDRSEIKYAPVWQRLLGAERALTGAVQERLYENWMTWTKDKFPREFCKKVRELARKEYEKIPQNGRNLILSFVHNIDKPIVMIDLCHKSGLPLPPSLAEREQEILHERYRTHQAMVYAAATRSRGDVPVEQRPLRLISGTRVINKTSKRKNFEPVDPEATFRNLGSVSRSHGHEDTSEFAEYVISTEQMILKLVRGQNPRTLLPQWEERLSNGKLCVLSLTSPEPPTENTPCVYEIVHETPKVVFVLFLSQVEEEQRLSARR